MEETKSDNYKEAFYCLIEKLEEFEELGTDIKVSKLLDYIYDILQNISEIEE